LGEPPKLMFLISDSVIPTVERLNNLLRGSVYASFVG
jgi:hypothetical protein